jgi:hypothetical protein
VRPFFARSAPPAGGDGMRKKDTEIPPERAFCLTSSGAVILGLWGCTFRGFLVIVSSCKFRWAQAPTVNYPGLLTSKNL